MKLYIGADHAGFELKEKIKARFGSELEIQDVGTHSTESTDYPDYAAQVARAVKENAGSFGLLICGSGIGMSIAANKIRGIRAAAVSEPKSAALAREHNDAQILCLGARIISEETASECLRAFLSARFDSAHERHQRRINKISKLEDFEL